MPAIERLPRGEMGVHTNKSWTDFLIAGHPEQAHNFDPKSETVLYSIVVSGYTLTVSIPPSKYSEPSFIIKVQGPATLKEAVVITDTPLEVQREYYRILDLAMSKVTKQVRRRKKQTDENGKRTDIAGDRVVFISHLNIEQERHGSPSARSRQDHGRSQIDQMVVLPQTLNGKPNEGEQWGLPAERAIFNGTKDVSNGELQKDERPYYLPAFVSSLEVAAKAIQPDFPKLTRLRRKPFGYSFLVAADPEVLAETLRVHAEAFSRVMQVAEDLEKEKKIDITAFLDKNIQEPTKKGRVVQPSFTQYLMKRRDGQWEVTISPMLVGIGGMERLGILINREKKYPEIYSPAFLKSYYLGLQSLLATTQL